LAVCNTPPDAPVQVCDFQLKPASAEVILHVAGYEYPAPILVTDLVALPATPSGPPVGLDELLMLLGRRVGAERALQIAEQRASDGAKASELDTFFGERFSPTDVFRAWWSVAEDLQDTALSVQAFRLRLYGSLGVGAAWRCMVDAVADQSMTPEEAWFYGAELLKTLREVDQPAGADRAAKCALLDSFCDLVRGELGPLGFAGDTRPWLRHVRAYYQEAGS
jgi:hypothetical protein